MAWVFNPFTGTFDWSGSGGGGGTPGGSSGQVQYNNGGSFGGLSQLTYSGGMINVVSSPFGLSGNISSTAWTTNGIRYKNSAATLTDTSSTGTVATAYTDLFGGNTIAASNSTTFTNYYTSWFNTPTAGSNVTFTSRWAMGLGGSLDIQAGTVTANTTPALNISQTWNAGAVTFTGLKFNAATGSSANSATGSLLLDLQLETASKFSVTKLGVVTVANRVDVQGISICYNGLASTLAWSSDTFLVRANTATLQLGAADVASGAVPQTLQVQSNTGAGTTGPNFTIKGSAGTTAGGSIIFQTAATTTHAAVLTLYANKDAGFTGSVFATADFISGTFPNFDLRMGGGAGGVRLASGRTVQWSSTADAYVGTSDLFLARDAANTLALRNSTNAQAFRVYNTYTDASNWEAMETTWGTNTCYLQTNKAGTGTQRRLYINGTNIVLDASPASSGQISWYGNLIAAADNAYDIGASGANRPRNLYVGTNIIAGGYSVIPGGVYYTGSGGQASGYDFYSIGSGRGHLLAANSGGGIMIAAFGGTTSSFPALKRVSANLQVIAADNSGSAGFIVGNQALATTATDGFIYVPTCAGTPTGTPTTQTGTAPIVVDTTNNKLYFYSGGAWRDAGP